MIFFFPKAVKLGFKSTFFVFSAAESKPGVLFLREIFV